MSSWIPFINIWNENMIPNHLLVPQNMAEYRMAYMASAKAKFIYSKPIANPFPVSETTNKYVLHAKLLEKKSDHLPTDAECVLT